MHPSPFQLVMGLLVLLNTILVSADLFSPFAARTAELSSTNSTRAKLRSPDGTCGGLDNYTCTGSDVEFGSCCSRYGYCGNISSYCLSTHGCQSAFGSCTYLHAEIATSSVDGQCGNDTTCVGGPWDGGCCSSSGFCGFTDEYCQLLPYGCQPKYGKCKQTHPYFSLDGTCGGLNLYACNETKFGHCCSKTGFCGNGPDYCGVNCDEGWGSCLSPSPDGTCGLKAGYTCIGSKYGDCCSANGWCGSTADYCSISRGCNNKTEGIPFPYLGICTLA